MHSIIFVSKEPNHEYISSLKNDFEVNSVKSVKAAIIYLVEFPTIDTILYDSLSIDHREIIDSLAKLKMLNPMILQIVSGDLELERSRLEVNKTVNSNSINEISSLIKNHALNRRESNRTEWPISVCYHNREVYDKKYKGLVMSISIGGCFIKTEQLDLGKEGDLLNLDIFFEDFNFLVEGEIVRVKRIADITSPQGFSIRFINPSPQTKSFIEKIINNRILSKIFSDFNHLEGF